MFELIAFRVQSYKVSYRQPVGLIFALPNNLFVLIVFQVFSDRIRNVRNVNCLVWSTGKYYRVGYCVPKNPCRYISDYTDLQSYYVWCCGDTLSWLASRGRERSFHHLKVYSIWSPSCRTLPYISRQYSERPWMCFWEKHLTAICFFVVNFTLFLKILLTLTKDAVIHECNICFLKLMLSLCPFLCVRIDKWLQP